MAPHTPPSGVATASFLKTTHGPQQLQPHHRPVFLILRLRTWARTHKSRPIAKLRLISAGRVRCQDWTCPARYSNHLVGADVDPAWSSRDKLTVIMASARTPGGIPPCPRSVASPVRSKPTTSTASRAIPVIGGALGVALVVGTLALFIGYIRRKRREGEPWLFHFILWPAYVGVLAVLGLAALHSSDNACGGPYECVGRIPLYWLPASLVLLSALLWWVEDFIIERRKSRLPAASPGPRAGPSER